MLISYPNKREYNSFQETFANLDLESDELKVIIVTPGVYQERVTLRGKHIRIIGIGDVIVDGAAYARQLGPDHQPINTFQTATFYCEGEDIVLDNLTIKNSAGLGKDVGQAVAFYGNGDNIFLQKCTIDAFQDTLFLAPLPPATKEGRPFNAPINQHEYLQCHRYTFENCEIAGNVDYIFGGGTAVFYRCILKTKLGTENGNAFIAAPSTYPDTLFGFVFIDCELTKDDHDVSNVYLARPWRPYGKAYYISCKIGSHIITKGWDNWNGDVGRERTSDFREYDSNQYIADRASWVVNKKQIDEFLMVKIFKYMKI